MLHSIQTASEALPSPLLTSPKNIQQLPIMYHQETLPDGSKDIVIPSLIPGKQITISYLYFPPDTFNEVNAGIESDQGFATVIPVLLQRQYPNWLNIIAAILTVIGFVTLIYFGFLQPKWSIAVA